MGLLSGDKEDPEAMRDPLGKPVSKDQLMLLANMMGIEEDLFLNIWLLAKMDGDSEHHIPETQAGLKTNYRFKCLRDLLEARTTNRTIQTRRRQFLEFFREKRAPSF